MSNNLHTEALEDLKQRVAMAYTPTPSDKWTHSDFTVLSQKIFEKTGMQISHMTLKRTWGKVQYKGEASVSTKDALAKFLDYQDFNDFLNQKHPKRPRKPSKKTNQKKRSLYIIILIIACLVGTVAIWLRYKPQNNPAQTITIKLLDEFKVLNPTDTVPHNFSVNYKLSDVLDRKNLSLKVDYLLNQTIQAQADSHAFVYLLPGVGYASILQNNITIAQKQIYTKTNGWECYQRLDADEIKGGYPEINPEISDSSLSVTAKSIYEAGIDTNSSVFVNLYNMQPFDANGNNCSFSATIKNIITGHRETGTCHIAIWCENGIVDLHYCKPGFTQVLYQTVGNKKITGAQANLTPFAIDVTQWQQIGFKTKKDTCYALHNNQVIASFYLEQNLGTVMGVRLGYKGLNYKAKNVVLKSQNQSVNLLMPAKKTTF